MKMSVVKPNKAATYLMNPACEIKWKSFAIGSKTSVDLRKAEILFSHICGKPRFVFFFFISLNCIISESSK